MNFSFQRYKIAAWQSCFVVTDEGNRCVSEIDHHLYGRGLPCIRQRCFLTQNTTNFLNPFTTPLEKIALVFPILCHNCQDESWSENTIQHPIAKAYRADQNRKKKNSSTKTLIAPRKNNHLEKKQQHKHTRCT
jgi:hypothetical protein